MADIEAYEMDLERPGRPVRRLIIIARKFDYDGGDNVRVLMTVADVTDARMMDKLKDSLLREKAILLQDLQHRIANSLQIIASVLLQSARRMASCEVRGHLYDAHDRGISLAALQHQLAVLRLGDVGLGNYFTELRQSLATAMISNPGRASLEVTGDDSLASPEVSVSLGLTVIELVINALKHAFPDRRKGRFTVDYDAHGQEWTLSVGDDGVGRATLAGGGKPGSARASSKPWPASWTRGSRSPTWARARACGSSAADPAVQAASMVAISRATDSTE